jgi:Family of unknown function (DUF6171)
MVSNYTAAVKILTVSDSHPDFRQTLIQHFPDLTDHLDAFAVVEKRHTPAQTACLNTMFANIATIREFAASRPEWGIEEPSLPQMALNLTRAVIETVKSAASGAPLSVSKDEEQRRLNICQSCEFFNAEKSTCRKCGCFMKFKTRLNSADCPAGKWALS